jgi:septal ring factor EnvC (AmiA/AmiB activator)
MGRPIEKVDADWINQHSYQRFDSDLNDKDITNKIEGLKNQLEDLDKIKQQDEQEQDEPTKWRETRNLGLFRAGGKRKNKKNTKTKKNTKAKKNKNKSRRRRFTPLKK